MSNPNLYFASLDGILQIWNVPYNQLSSQLQRIVTNYITGYATFSIQDETFEFCLLSKISNLPNSEVIHALNEIHKSKANTSYTSFVNGLWIYAFSEATSIYLELAGPSARNDLMVKWRDKLNTIVRKKKPRLINEE